VSASVSVPAQDDSLDRKTILALVAMGVAVLVVANDFTAMTVAIPSIERDLDTNLSTAQWVINAYALVFGVLIVTGGRLADTYGRRRLFIIGAGIFAVFSVIGGFATDAWWLLGARAIMGVGGAMMWPAILGMTFALLPESKAGLAGGIILGAAGMGNAIGPLLGGALTDALSWRWILFVNLPIAIIAVLVTLRAVDADEPGEPERLDYAGVATLSFGLLCALLALDQSSTWGWGDPRVIAFMVASVILLVAFGVVEKRAGDRALVPADVMRNAKFVAVCVVVLLMSAVFFSILLYLPQFMTVVLHFSPLKAGAGLLPMMVTFAAMSFAAGPLYNRLGPKIIVSSGALFMTVGMGILAQLGAGDSYTSLVPGLVVIGIGLGLFYSSVTTAGVTALDASRSSLAGGIVYMCQIAGGSIGLGLNTAIVTAGEEQAAGGLVNGIGTAFTLDTILALAGLLVAVLFVGGRMRAARGGEPVTEDA
jgi:EmrB/QacA subfamily drug resistance transporter